jgi:hypothetical protein
LWQKTFGRIPGRAYFDRFSVKRQRNPLNGEKRPDVLQVLTKAQAVRAGWP